jgi:hypothetical protein
VTGGAPQTGRLTPRQAVGWGLAFLIILVLILLFFKYGRQVRPILGERPAGAWLTNLS